MMRLFIAIPLARSVEQRLARIIADLRPAGGPVKWVDAKNIHLTIRFLGDTDEKMIPHLTALIAERAANSEPVDASIAKLGAFPNLHRPNVIWAGIDGNLGPVLELSRQIETAIRMMGWVPEDKPFRPHLTLARIREHRDLQALSDVVANYKVPETPLRLERLVLFHSTLTPEGPIYRRVAEALLGEARF